MSIIRSHDVTLYGGSGIKIVLRPLCDEHLPLLYKWCADPEVLYFTEGGEDIVRSYPPEIVDKIYGGVSRDALCFLIEADGVPIGECWLQRMNLPEVKGMYPKALDVRRIDMAIGERAYWNKGIGRQFVGMMVDYAFCGEHVDLLHCFSEDYNVRSCRTWEKCGFSRVLSEPLVQPQKGRWQYHYRLTRREFMDGRRADVPRERQFTLPIGELQPSQLYISAGKLRLVREWFGAMSGGAPMDPIPVKRLGGWTVMTDGHTRALAAVLGGLERLPVYWDEDELDMDAYATCVGWCEDAGIRSPTDLAGRVISHKEYGWLWHKRCMDMLP